MLGGLCCCGCFPAEGKCRPCPVPTAAHPGWQQRWARHRFPLLSLPLAYQPQGGFPPNSLSFFKKTHTLITIHLGCASGPPLESSRANRRSCKAGRGLKVPALIGNRSCPSLVSPWLVAGLDLLHLSWPSGHCPVCSWLATEQAWRV